MLPLKLYEVAEPDNNQGLFDKQVSDEEVINGKYDKYKIQDGITDKALTHFREVYKKEGREKDITKEDIFYYIYGLLHSEDYRVRYANNLSKQLPHIPYVKQEKDFWAFSKAGRELADLHLNYETVEFYPVKYKVAIDNLKAKDYRVEKMRFGGG